MKEDETHHSSIAMGRPRRNVCKLSPPMHLLCFGPCASLIPSSLLAQFPRLNDATIPISALRPGNKLDDLPSVPVHDDNRNAGPRS